VVYSAPALTPEESTSASSEGDSHTQFLLMTIKKLEKQLEAASDKTTILTNGLMFTLLRWENSAFAALQCMLGTDTSRGLPRGSSRR
jgi:hypothetical protein